MIRRRWLRRFWSDFFPLCGQKVEVEHVASCTSFKRLIRNFFSFFFLLIRKCCTMLSDAKPANRDSLHLIKVVHETQMNHLTNINCWRFVEVLPHYKFASITKSLLHQRCKSLAPPQGGFFSNLKITNEKLDLIVVVQCAPFLWIYLCSIKVQTYF